MAANSLGKDGQPEVGLVLRGASFEQFLGGVCMATEGEILGRKQDKEKGGFEGEGEREEQLGGGK